MVDDVVRGVAHPEQSTGGVQMAGHPSSHIHILPYSLNKQIHVMKMFHMPLDETESSITLPNIPSSYVPLI